MDDKTMAKMMKAGLACLAMYILIYAVVSVAELIIWEVLGI